MSSRTTRKVHVRAIDKIGSDQGTFLLGNISDLLYEMKCLAEATAATKSLRIKWRSIAKLKQVLERNLVLLGRHFKEIMCDFIKDSFKVKTFTA